MPSPCFQFYPEEFVGSGTVGTADANEVACYVLLLCLDWTEGGFVYDEKRLARWCKVSPAAFRRAWSHLADKFPARDGRHFNTRLEKERQKQADWREKSRKGAEAANAKRWGGGRGGDEMANANASPNDRIPLPLPSPSRMPEVQPQTTTTLPAPRKQRASRAKAEGSNGTTWLTPSAIEWEKFYAPGSFPYGQAAKEFKPLRDAGHSPETIARYLAWYLEVRGLDTLDPDPAVIAKVRFTPNLRDFRLRFGAFNPDRSEEGSANATPREAWVAPAVKLWTAQVGVISAASVRSDLRVFAGLYRSEELATEAILTAIRIHVETMNRRGERARWSNFVANIADSLPPHLIVRPAEAA